MKRKIYIAVALLAIIILSVALGIYAHTVYESENTLYINSVLPGLQKSTNGTYQFNGININVSNNGNSYQNVSIFFINRYPIQDGIATPNEIAPIAPHSSKDYEIGYSVKNITNNTKIYVMAFSKDYITTKTVSIEINSSK